VVHVRSAPATSRPASISGAPTRSKNLRRCAKGRADLEKPTAYSEQEKIEHQSILGADPAGYGFYLYPKTAVAVLNEKTSKVDYYGGPYSNSGVNSASGRGTGNDGGSRRWREPKGGRNFRRNVTSQVIVEEEANEGQEEPPVSRPQRRHSEVPGQLRQPRSDAVSVPTLPRPVGNSTPQSARSPSHGRQRSLHNDWAHITAQKQQHLGPLPSLQLPTQKRGEVRASIDSADETALADLHRDAMMFVNKSNNDECDAQVDSSSQQITDKLGDVIKIPVLRVEMVDV